MLSAAKHPGSPLFGVARADASLPLSMTQPRRL